MGMPVPSTPSTAIRDLSIAIPIAFALRLANLILTNRVIDMADAIHYINMARQFVAGDALNFDENLPVLYSLFGAAFYWLTDDWERAFWIVSLISSSLLTIPIYFIARELHGPKSARLSIAFIGCWPWLIDYACRIAPEALAVTLWFTAIWLLYLGIQGNAKALYIAPIAFFALHLTRPEGTFLMLGSPVAAAACLCYKESAAHWKRLGIYTVLIASLTVAYALTMRAIIGTPTVAYRAPVSTDLLEYFNNAAVPLAETFLRLNFDVLPVMLGPLLLIFFGIGFFRYSDTARVPRLEALLLAFCLLQWAMTVVNLTPAPRYIMTVIIAMSLWSVKGIELLHDRAKYFPKYRWLRVVPATLVFLTFGIGLAEPLAAQYYGNMPRIALEYKVAGRWMEDHLEPGFILCRKPQVGFYANMASIGPDTTHTPDTLSELAKEIGARYLVFDARHSENILPALSLLLDENFSHPHYKLLNDTTSDREDTRVVIYQFITPGIEYMTPDEYPQMSSHYRPGQQRRRTDTP
ncbi:MAG: glycosyltransferase family 39 protein [Candidatus Hydrogenedentota bacterium]